MTTMQICGKQYVPPDHYQRANPSASFRIHKNAETLDTEVDEWADFTVILNYCVKDARDLSRAINNNVKNAAGETLSAKEVSAELSVIVGDLEKISKAAAKIIAAYSGKTQPLPGNPNSRHWPLGYLALPAAKEMLDTILLPKMRVLATATSAENSASQ